MTAEGSTSRQKVLVTGAAGKTGRLVLQKLQERSDLFDAVGVVRREPTEATTTYKMIVADVCDVQAIQKACTDESPLHSLIICTSATPAPTGEMTPDGTRPVFGFPNGQPEQVDWIGQKNQIDAAKKAGASHVIICSSMGGTDPGNPLNALGRSEDGKEGGNILLWKRKAEKYLIDSGLTYTIIHPGGLLDEDGGEREIVVGINDKQLATDNRSIPRADVAELLVASLLNESFKNRSFDARTKPPGEGTVTRDFGKLLEELEGNCDYSLGKIP